MVRVIDIAFCVGCNYQPRAAALAATLREAYPQAIVTLTPTGGGKFELSADGKIVFSKERLGRHLLPGEALERLSTMDDG
ncbi:MAG TPA: SelT/SelW/SelH family protein [Gemmatimonadaceae bacterium]|jgi:selT/selW/selH-like putative selenoprotein|nr:SelT/SelW/SelH family protein [Gemmatimonadaceae bacterium]HRQ78589.1 SelT/SelW/SelH family protein [Gemmatimonadaceae bacterium]